MTDADDCEWPETDVAHLIENATSMSLRIYDDVTGETIYETRLKKPAPVLKSGDALQITWGADGTFRLAVEEGKTVEEEAEAVMDAGIAAAQRVIDSLPVGESSPSQNVVHDDSPAPTRSDEPCGAQIRLGPSIYPPADTILHCQRLVHGVDEGNHTWRGKGRSAVSWIDRDRRCFYGQFQDCTLTDDCYLPAGHFGDCANHEQDD